MQITVNKWGNSLAVRLPKQLVTELSIEQDEVLDYQIQDGKLVIEKVKSTEELTMAELFKDYSGEVVDTKLEVFESMGEEKW